MSEILEIPEISKCSSVHEYLYKLDEYIKNKDEPLRKDILNFINKWLKTNKDNELHALTNFRYRYLEYMPSDEQSKNFLIKNFEKYNEKFNLDFEYNEELFTTLNLLYFLKHMLRKIGYDLIKDKKTGTEKYTIIIKKNDKKNDK